MSYIASISYGKDSLKMLDVIISRNLPLDRIITFDVWATDTIPAELPEVTEFKNNMDIYIKDKYGIEVEHLCARYNDGSKVTYEKEFYRVIMRGSRAGNIVGFPFLVGPWCNSKLKINAKKGAVKKGDIEYIGIAYDEKKRQKSLNNFKVAPLVDFGIDEDLCGLYCMYEGILSPTYANSYRDGCWFCHNQGIDQLRLLRKNYPELWSLLLKWDNDSVISTFKPNLTVHDFELRFSLEDEHLLSSTIPFRWAQLFQPLQYSFY